MPDLGRPAIDRTARQLRVVVVDRVRGHLDALVHAVRAAAPLEPVAMGPTLSQVTIGGEAEPADAVIIQVWRAANDAAEQRCSR